MKVHCGEVAERMHSSRKKALLAFAEGEEATRQTFGGDLSPDTMPCIEKAHFHCAG